MFHVKQSEPALSFVLALITITFAASGNSVAKRRLAKVPYRHQRLREGRAMKSIHYWP